jgi:hypothetical protein
MNNFLHEGGVRMNFFKSKFNKKGMSGAVKASIILLTLAFVVASVSYIIPGFANGGGSPVYGVLTPIWTNPNTKYTFRVDVYNPADSGYNVSEFRIYNNTNYVETEWSCYPDNSTPVWYGPSYVPSFEGVFCIYTKKLPDDNIQPGQSKFYFFDAKTKNDEGCCWLWHLEAKDTNFTWHPFYTTYSCVDKAPPETTKKYGDPTKEEGGYRWITSDTLITLTAVDKGPKYPPTGQIGVGVDKIYWRNTVLDIPDEKCIEKCEYEGKGDWNEKEGDTVTFYKKEESCHLIEFYAVDKLGNTENVHRQCVYVDNTPPISVKTHGTPLEPGDGFDWVTQNTKITLDCDDSHDGTVPHPVDEETLCYKVSFDDPEKPDLTKQYCIEFGGKYEDGWCCAKRDDKKLPYTFHFMEDSNHDLQYFCKDYLGNDERDLPDVAPHIQYYKVDTEPPKITKTMLGTEGKDYLGKCPPKSESDICYVADNGNGGIQIKVEDGGEICAVGFDDTHKCYTEVWWKASEEDCKAAGGIYKDGWCRVYAAFFNDKDHLDIIFKYDSTHKIITNCEDALGNKMPEDVEIFLVDSTPPVTSKTYGKPYVKDWYPKGCYDNCEDYCYDYCDGEPGCMDECMDYCLGKDCGMAEWINSSTSISLSAKDEKVGVDKIYWRNLLVKKGEPELICGMPKKYCNPETYMGNVVNPDEPFTEYKGEPFYKKEESCHVIEFYSVDKLGNKEDLKWQCVFVDDTAPLTDKKVGTPSKEGDHKPVDWWVNSSAPITLSCWDTGDHPVDHVSLKYRYRVSDDCKTWGDWIPKEGWSDPNGHVVEKTIYFPEDSCHQLEYYCEDGLGNAGPVKTEIDIVDTKPPVIEKPTIVGSHFYNETEEKMYIDGVTEIHVNAHDPEPHPVGEVKCDWWYYLDDSKTPTPGESGLTPPFVIKFKEETKHALHVECHDALGNEIGIEEMVLYVDKTPPTTTKIYGTPSYPERINDGAPYPHYISSSTPITLSVEDAGPHKTGIQGTFYRVTMVDDKYCMDEEACVLDSEGSGDFQPYLNVFTIPKESCHLIEYYSTDNVDKTEKTKKQCVFVDNTAPEVFKELGEPKTIWYPTEEDKINYPESALCENGLTCYKITMTTPITITCEDKGPHPVDKSTIYYRYYLDGKLKEDYCEHGNWDSEKKYCVVKEANEITIYFPEETVHKLEYYCEDALGNGGGEIKWEIDKVEGSTFDIELCKKWNLISVPFVLLNSDPNEVFKGLDVVKTVWAYDDGKWYLWQPEIGGTLDSIKPGWGYWVLTNDSGTLTVGGSLLSSGPVGPPSRELKDGWNLIGYYGATSMYNDYWGSDWWYEQPVYCALNTLVDTQQGFPRWGSLFSYDCGNWEWLNACCQTYHYDEYYHYTWCPNYMEAGKGYWIEMDREDEYAPATNCIWDENMQCVWPYD